MKKYTQSLLLSCLLLTGSITAGVLQPITGILRTTAGSPVVLTDSVEILTTTTGSSADYNIKNIVSLNFDQNSDTFLISPTTVRVKLTIYRWDGASSLISPNRTEYLDVSYDNRYNKQVIDKSSLKLKDGYRVIVRVDSIYINGVSTDTLPRFVYVESEIHMTRYYQYTGGAVTLSAKDTLNTDCDAGGYIDELRFNWGTVTGAEEYQLEWTFVNNYGKDSGTYYSQSALYADFKNNSTRITTTATNYRISLLYEKGYVAYRVRAVGRNYLDPDKYIYGSWSSGDLVTINSLGTNAKYHNWREHEKLKNWQYSASYAEEGKKKEVVSYFDGSLHNRQSVTKVNSDKNVIVGETIYDYQGRPAVNVLPTPVVFPNCTTSYVEPSLKFYPKYNRNTIDSTYSKTDFDIDTISVCDPFAGPMDTLIGSSQYYSGNNPDQSYQQAFIPDAKRYPFSQIEYTPDNTGRIRSQSGVGIDHQLGSGHETKYLYGQPNQVQVDRLFGSEAGDASHLKKNVVIDANGQASVSYMNQEGKTVATALAGNPPMDTSYVTMTALSSAANATDTLTVDLFNKDSDGNSLLNKVTALNEGIEFSSQLTVAYTSDFVFNYDLAIDSLADSCLITNICISCIYDLEIKVTDECGINLLLTNDTIHKMVGHLDSIPDGFTMNCNGPTGTSEADTISLTLEPGVYTVSKVLTINKDARDFYIANYLDTTYNSCVRTLSDFTAEALAAIDTTACHPTCQDCADALGTKDDYVSSGRGTEIQYDLLYEECFAPCREMSLCESSYEMMLMDVTPGGQYAQFNSATGTSSDVLSVLNTLNNLPANTGSANWRNPKMVLNTAIYNIYVNSLGERIKIPVVADGSNYLPKVSNTANVYTEVTTGELYIYPENLYYLDDFITSWDPAFARSLVLYHPEYAYYIACKDESRKMSGDNRSSEQLDSLILFSEDFAAAVTNGFIKTNYDTITNHDNRIHDWFTQSSSHAYDPFFTNTTAYNSFYGPFPSPYTIRAGYSYTHTTAATQMQAKFNNFITIGGVSYSMPEAAAMTARCGNNFNSTPSAACIDFGGEFFSGPDSTAKNDSIRDKEWEILKHFYISEKRKFEFKRMDFFAKHIANSANSALPSSDLLGGGNPCIGVTGFNPYSAGFFMPLGSFTYNSPGYDASQPCSFYNLFKFTNSQKRFTDPSNSGLSGGSVPYQIYEQTGQCPMGFLLQNFLDKMAQDSLLTSVPSINLNSISEFAPDLYNAISGTVPDSGFVNYQYNLTGISGDVLTAVIIDSTATSASCTITLDIDSTSIPSFASITSLQNLSFHYLSGGMYHFKVTAIYAPTDSTTDTANIKGSSCINIKDCNFQAICSGNQFASDFMNLLNIMKANGLEQSSAYNISADTLIEPAIGFTLKNTLGTPNTNLRWKYIAPSKYQVYDNADTTTRLMFTILSNDTLISDTMITAFSNIRSNYNHLFKMAALDTNYVMVATLDGKAEKITGTDTVGISMGECGFPDPVECTFTENKVSNDLENLLNEVLTVKPFDNNINLFEHVNFTSLLKSYMAYDLDSTSSLVTYDSTTEILTFTVDSSCAFNIYHDTTSIGMVFDSLIAVTNFTGVPPLDAENNYHDFYFVALYDNGGSTVSDTVWGTSCWPIKNCDHCDTNTVSPVAIDSTTGTIPLVYGGWNSNGYTLSNIDTSDCANMYFNYYLPAITSYNSSLYATLHSDTLSTGFFSSLETFYNLIPNCSCGESYHNYLNDYIIADSSSTLPLPVELSAYSGCEPRTVCDSIYDAYIDVSVIYNTIVDTTASLHYPFATTLEKPAFMSKYCNCAVKFTATLTGLIYGPVLDSTVVYEMVDINNACETAPCIPAVPDTAFVFPPLPYSQDPCVTQMINAAIQNAENDYNNYRDSIITSIASRYNEHCLSALENFTYTYADKEYHFTLYYYDQAGNLVKTIPPEGVELLDIDSYADALSIQINSDRTNNHQNVFTSHRMATNYEYNSLNQLVYQDLPDHDKMELVEFLLPNGLDSRLRIQRTQFVNTSKGFLSGYLVDGSSITRGYVYTTNNGGNNWTRVNNTVGADIHDIYFVSSTTGYAAAANGVVLKTTDGGSSWAATNLYTTFLYTNDLNAVYFSSTSTGVVAGSKTASAAGIYYTTNGGTSYTAGSGLAALDTVTSIAYDGSNYYATVKNNGEGKIYKSADSHTWTEAAQKRAGDLSKVQYITLPSGITGYAAGVDGTLLKTAAGANTAWYVKATGTAGSFKDIYFKNVNEGIAMIDSSANKGQIWKTFDGGNTWELLSTPGDYYTSFQAYDSVKLMASGENGLLAKVLINSSPFGMIKLSKPSYVNDLAHTDAVYYSGSPQTIAVGNNDTIYYTENANLSGVSWTKIKTTSFGVSAPNANFKKIAIKDTLDNVLKGTLLTQNGKLYSFYKDTNDVFSFSLATVQDLAASPISSYFFNDLVMDTRTSTKFYAFDTISKRAFTGTITTTGSPTVTFTYMDTVTTQHKGVRSIAVNSAATDFLMVGDKGIIKYKASPNSTTTNYSNRTYAAKPLPLNDLAVKASNNVYAAGDDGGIWSTADGTTWKLLNTGMSEKINANAITDAGGFGAVACDGGLLYKQTITDSLNITLTAVDINTTENLTSLAMSDSNTYVGTSAGTVIHVPNITAATYENTGITGMNGSFSALAFKTSSSLVYAGGTGSAMYQCLNTSSARMHELYLSYQLLGMSFADANNGYLLSNSGDIRRTADGGNNWTVINPTTISMNNIYAVSADRAIVLGTNKYCGVINDNATPVSQIVSGGGATVSLLNIDFNESGLGVMTGTLRSSYALASTGSGYAISYLGQTPLSGGLNYALYTVKVFKDSSFLAAGGRSQIYYYKSGTFYAQNNYGSLAGSTQAILDINFLDDRTAYLVGTRGLKLKCVLTGNITDNGYGNLASSIVWDSIKLSDPFGIYNSGTAANIDIYTVDFVDRHHGFLGGFYNTLPTNAKYAMLIDDQSDYYSTRFYYDKLGRMVLSQNTKQFNRSPKAYSYTKYDALGRIAEVGEKTENTTGTIFRRVFGSYVNAFYNSNTINDDSISTWLAGSGARKEVTRTYYDTVTFSSIPVAQENLRKRVTSVTYENVDDGIDSTYQHATHYTYDIHGNVNTLLQDNPEISVSGQRYKRIDYDYDLISGKVNKVTYQPDAPDLFIHKYTYDADNRITKVETSSDDILWDLDAKYFYYAHGPLARAEYGKNQVQGVDYAYTLQGWIKGVNSNTLESSRDMGQDGLNDTSNLNQYFGEDAFGYTLGYYAGDYKAINGLKWSTVTNRFEAQTAGSDMEVEREDLFNGNISHMVASIVKTDTTGAGTVDVQIPKALSSAYNYDQLNRLSRSLSFDNIDIAANEWLNDGLSTERLHKNEFSYDANGNILTQRRFDDSTNLFDEFAYNYKRDVSGNLIHNRLYHINDAGNPASETDDIEDQGAFVSTEATINTVNNYRYDEIGNLIADSTEQIDTIKWTVYGKIKEIKRTSGSSKKNLIFDYDASGNRISKQVLTSANVWENTTYYTRDAQGNVMSTYKQEVIDSTMSFKLNEQHLYGSARIGMVSPDKEMIGADTLNEFAFDTLNKRVYELSNHLGNVLTTISDRKVALDTNSDNYTDYLQADIVSNNDYSAFGAPLSGRNYVSSSTYRYGFNGKEKDDEAKGAGAQYDYGFRIYDPRLGKFLSVDPLSKKFPWYTPYQFAGNKPIAAIDLDGLEDVYITKGRHEESMIVSFNSTDVKQIIAGHPKDVKLRVFYNGKETTQFEGPNKSNENKVYTAAFEERSKSILKSDADYKLRKLKEPGLPGGVQSSETPSLNVPIEPTPPPASIAKPPGSLNVEFKQSSPEFENENETKALVKPYADYLLANPNTTLSLVGNTNVSVDSKGEPINSLNEQFVQVGKGITIYNLQLKRAEAVKAILVNIFHIDPARINTARGKNDTNGKKDATGATIK